MAPNKNLEGDTITEIPLQENERESGENKEKEDNPNEKNEEKEVEETEKNKRTKWQIIKDELRINKKLLPIKLATFGYHGGVFSFLPFLTLHMGQLGLTNAEIGLIYAILPIPSILGPLISGMLADKLKAFKAVFLCNVFFLAIFHTSLIWTPMSPGIPVLTCTGVPQEPFRIIKPPSCASLNESLKYDLSDAVPSDIKTVNATLSNCKYKCSKSKPSTARWCFSNDSCVEKPLGEKVDIVLGLSVPPKIVSPEGQEEDGETCNDVKIVTSNFDAGSLCQPSCPLECSVEGVLDSVSWQFSTTFWVYLTLRALAQFFISAAFTMLDAVTMAVVTDLGGDFGKQRLVTVIGLGLMPLISSLFINAAPLTETGNPDYTVAFYVGDALLSMAFITMAAMTVKEVSEPASNMFKGVSKLLTKFEIVVFLLVILVLGSNWGFLESFFLVYLRQLEAPPYLLGLTMTFGCAVGIPAMVFSDRIIRKFGRHNIFILSFLAYSVRMFGYSFITNPWMSLPFEALEVITYQIMWVAAVTYFPILAPPNLLATISGISGTVHYNVGRGVGSFLGGNLMGPLGAKNTFRVFGVLSLGSGVAYGLLHYCYLDKRIQQKRDEVEAAEGRDGQDNQAHNNSDE